MQASEFLTSAEGMLVAGNPSEVHARNAMSRAYYFAYHVTLPVAQKLPGWNLKGGGGMHEQLIWNLTNVHVADPTFPQRTSAAAIGYVLRQMKLLRQNADYDLAEWTATCDEAELQLAHAKRLQTKVSELERSLGAKAA